MNRTWKIAILLLGTLFLTSCGNKEEKQPSNPPMNAETSEEETNEDFSPAEKTAEEIEKERKEKEGEEKKALTKEWVREAEVSEGKDFRIPYLNETILGEPAKLFNQEIENNFSVSEDLLKETEYLRKQVDYFTFTDLTTDSFSLIAKLITINGDVIYRSFVVDLNTKQPLDYEEALKRTGYTGEEVKKEVEKFYSTLYASADFDYLSESDVDVELEDYLKERMEYFEGSIRKEVPLGVEQTEFSIEDGKLNLYTVIRVPGFGAFFYRPYFVRRDVIENALLNGNYRSILARINPTREPLELKNPKIVADLSTDAVGEKYHFIGLRDDIGFRISQIEYDEKTEDFKEVSVLYEGVLNEGDTVALDTVVPEGIPMLRIFAECRLKEEDAEEERVIQYVSELGFQGRFEPPMIEYLDGKDIQE